MHVFFWGGDVWATPWLSSGLKPGSVLRYQSWEAAVEPYVVPGFGPRSMYKANTYWTNSLAQLFFLFFLFFLNLICVWCGGLVLNAFLVSAVNKLGQWKFSKLFRREVGFFFFFWSLIDCKTCKTSVLGSFFPHRLNFSVSGPVLELGEEGSWLKNSVKVIPNEGPRGK